jgi:hypothetical protein
LSGTTTVKLSGGMAAFSNLSINQAGTGYTLTASVAGSSITSATSAAFNVSSSNPTPTPVTGSVVEGFEGSSTYYVVGSRQATAYVSTVAAHDGKYGLVDTNGNDWIYRDDAAAQVKAGDTVSVWLKFAGTADGRAYLGFGASSAGTLSLVAAPNSNQLLIQDNSGWGFTTIGSVSQTWQPNHWYRMEVDWGTNGSIIGKVFDSDGTTLVQTVTASSTAITSGGFAFRAIGSNKYWDTVQVTPAANQSVAAVGSAPGRDASGSPFSTVNTVAAGQTPAVSGYSLAARLLAGESGMGGVMAGNSMPSSSLGNTSSQAPFDSRLVDAYFGLAGELSAAESLLSQKWGM